MSVMDTMAAIQMLNVSIKKEVTAANAMQATLVMAKIVVVSDYVMFTIVLWSVIS